MLRLYPSVKQAVRIFHDASGRAVEGDGRQ